MVERVESYSTAMWSVTPIDRSKIVTLLEEAYRVHDAPLNEDAAAQWGKENFPGGIPPSAVDKCEAVLRQREGDLEALARDRLQGLLPGRLKANGINDCVHPTNPGGCRLLELAGGMFVQ